jgi:hypothetical protein
MTGAGWAAATAAAGGHDSYACRLLSINLHTHPEPVVKKKKKKDQEEYQKGDHALIVTLPS